ncbi:hypothetical protein E2C01_065918 [Portunus trituberculatus]|uniref:Uncharacterized protein n=1 Tax=Portunus trituberculatus TaxID=210409 RepID=A0A5B7HT53_PORTR|nr:hypothetical protein [Portunus trituberculatus]
MNFNALINPSGPGGDDTGAGGRLARNKREIKQPRTSTSSSQSLPRPAQFVHRLPPRFSSAILSSNTPFLLASPGSLAGYLATYTPLLPLRKHPWDHRGPSWRISAT